MQSWGTLRGSALPTTLVHRSSPASQNRTGIVVAVLALALLAVLLVGGTTRPHFVSVPGAGPSGAFGAPNSAARLMPTTAGYNDTYPASAPIVTGMETRFRIAIVADMDKRSRSQAGDSWRSSLIRGELVRSHDRTYKVELDVLPITLNTELSEKGRGLELSELQFYNGKLYTVDDRTGIVFEIVGSSVVPRHILTDGDGNVAKGFKAEWMTIKDQKLIVGGMGKEWTTPDGKPLNAHPQWVKSINLSGHISHINWVQNYNALLAAAGVSPPGYAIHESAAWSEVHKQWFFMPRRVSSLAYNDVDDERKGTNLLLRADDKFERITVTTLGSLIPTHGFSSFKFVPGTKDREIVALKTEELSSQVATYMVVFDIETGRELMPETKISSEKLEGLEFI